MRSKICLPHASAVGMFMQWYNHEHRHSAIRFMTPAQRHESIDVSLLEKRAVVYEAAKQQRPEHWSGANQNWQPVLVMYLNPDQHIKDEYKKGDFEHKIAT